MYIFICLYHIIIIVYRMILVKFIDELKKVYQKETRFPLVGILLINLAREVNRSWVR